MVSAAINMFTQSLAARVTALLVLIAALSIAVMVTIACLKIYAVTEDNAEIRIDRASRAAASILSYALPETFAVRSREDGSLRALQVLPDDAGNVLVFSDEFDGILARIGQSNQGAANLFRFNPQTDAFDRFATTFRRPDGSMPPPMSLTAEHPAFTDLRANQTYVGEVPIMGRMRLAYLTPIQDRQGNLAGALAVDVGWVDDLQAARDDLHSAMLAWSVALLLLVALLGTWRSSHELRPLLQIAKLANRVASGGRRTTVPFACRTDEIGALAQGLSRVFDLQDRLEDVAYVDPLTGLGNRARYLETLKKVVTNASDNGVAWALIHVNIDNFVKVNSGLGYETGDRVLKLVAQQLRKTFRDAVCVTRDGGDDFSVIVRRYGSVEELRSRCEAALSDLREPIPFAEGNVYLDCSIGIARLPEDATDSEAAHRNADLALRMARDTSGSKIGLFNATLDQAAERRHRIETRLRKAIEASDITAHYQPQVCGSTHMILGVEALARWNDKDEGMVSPGEFIPIAEQAGLIGKLGHHILSIALSQAAEWTKQGVPFGRVSVNVSPQQLWQSGFVDQLKFLLDTHELPGDALCVEITESIFIAQDEGHVSDLLEQIKQLGVRIALDDFGAGYSSLGYLDRLPCDALKIDRAFVHRAPSEPDKAKLLRGMIGLGKGLGLTVIAEGAETIEEVALANSAGCDAIQGFYFAKPHPAGDIPGVLQNISKPALKTASQKRSA